MIIDYLRSGDSLQETLISRFLEDKFPSYEEEVGVWFKLTPDNVSQILDEVDEILAFIHIISNEHCARVPFNDEEGGSFEDIGLLFTDENTGRSRRIYSRQSAQFFIDEVLAYERLLEPQSDKPSTGLWYHLDTPQVQTLRNWDVVSPISPYYQSLGKKGYPGLGTPFGEYGYNGNPNDILDYHGNFLPDGYAHIKSLASADSLSQIIPYHKKLRLPKSQNTVVGIDLQVQPNRDIEIASLSSSENDGVSFSWMNEAPNVPGASNTLSGLSGLSELMSVNPNIINEVFDQGTLHGFELKDAMTLMEATTSGDVAAVTGVLMNYPNVRDPQDLENPENPENPEVPYNTLKRPKGIDYISSKEEDIIFRKCLHHRLEESIRRDPKYSVEFRLKLLENLTQTGRLNEVEDSDLINIAKMGYDEVLNGIKFLWDRWDKWRDRKREEKKEAKDRALAKKDAAEERKIEWEQEEKEFQRQKKRDEEEKAIQKAEDEEDRKRQKEEDEANRQRQKAEDEANRQRQKAEEEEDYQRQMKRDDEKYQKQLQRDEAKYQTQKKRYAEDGDLADKIMNPQASSQSTSQSSEDLKKQEAKMLDAKKEYEKAEKESKEAEKDLKKAEAEFKKADKTANEIETAKKENDEAKIKNIIDKTKEDTKKLRGEGDEKDEKDDKAKSKDAPSNKLSKDEIKDRVKEVKSELNKAKVKGDEHIDRARSKVQTIQKSDPVVAQRLKDAISKTSKDLKPANKTIH